MIGLLTRRKLSLLLLGSAAALALTAAPYRLAFDAGVAKLTPAAAWAKDGHGGDSGSGSDDDSDDDDNSGSGGDDSGGDDDNSESGSGHDSGGHGSDDSGSDDHGSSGHGSDDANDDSPNSSGRSRGSDDNSSGGLFGRRGAEHVNPRNGVKVEISGSNIEVVHPDGTKEEIENGVYEMKDASGRTIVERRARESDRARLNAMAG